MQKLNLTLKKIDRILITGADWICRAMLAIQVIICAGVFFGRYFFKSTPAWGEPAALLCLVWLCVLSSSLAIEDDSHLRMTVFDEILPGKVLIALEILTTVVIFLFAIFMIYAGIMLTSLSRNNIVPGINISASWMNLVLPVTGFMYIVALIEQWRRRIELWHQN
ncbi:MAG: TRAP transporter small permease [Lachnospiraceae bacterium]